jgi:hypothetical protein
MRKPVLANIAVVGAGVGVLSFATGDCCLPLKALIAAPRSLRRLDRLGAMQTTSKPNSVSANSKLRP